MFKDIELPLVDIHSEKGINHSAEVARLVNEMAVIIEEQKDEIIRLRAQIEILKDLVRSSMGAESAQKSRLRVVSINM